VQGGLELVLVDVLEVVQLGIAGRGEEVDQEALLDRSLAGSAAGQRERLPYRDDAQPAAQIRATREVANLGGLPGFSNQQVFAQALLDFGGGVAVDLQPRDRQ